MGLYGMVGMTGVRVGARVGLGWEGSLGSMYVSGGGGWVQALVASFVLGEWIGLDERSTKHSGECMDKDIAIYIYPIHTVSQIHPRSGCHDGSPFYHQITT